MSAAYRVQTSFPQRKVGAGSPGVDSERRKRSLIVGLGATGLAAAKYLTARGERVRIIDSRAHPPGLTELRAQCPEAEVVLETLDARWLEGMRCVVLSPGLSVDVAVARAALEHGIPLVSDIELFARAAAAPIVAVTGSNGKSTVTTLVAWMLQMCGLRAPAGGNFGPACARASRRFARRRVCARDLELPNGDDAHVAAARRRRIECVGRSLGSARHTRALCAAQGALACRGRARGVQRG